MKCPNCGRENSDIRLFCSKCGEMLPDGSERPEIFDDIDDIADEKPRRPRRPTIEDDDFFSVGGDFEESRERKSKPRSDERYRRPKRDDSEAEDEPDEEPRRRPKRRPTDSDDEPRVPRQRDEIEDESDEEPERRRFVTKDEPRARRLGTEVEDLSDDEPRACRRGTEVEDWSDDEPRAYRRSEKVEDWSDDEPDDKPRARKRNFEAEDWSDDEPKRRERQPSEDLRRLKRRPVDDDEPRIRRRSVEIEDWPEDEPRPRRKVESIFRDDDEKPREAYGPYSRPRPKHPPRLDRRADEPSERRGSVMTPRRAASPDSFFTVADSDPFDEMYDSDEREPDAVSEKLNFEEPESRSFFMRHVRGIVAMILTFITLSVFLVWANTADAQLMLAQFDIAWSASAYSRLGEKAFADKDYYSSAQYYEKAFNRDNREDYAIQMWNSYINLRRNTDAVSAMRKCIELNPNNAEYYLQIKNLYSDQSAMPDDLKQLIAQGYQLTGDQRLAQ